MKRTGPLIAALALLLLPAVSGRATAPIPSLESGKNGDEARVLRARNLHRRGFPRAHFSGLTHLSGDR